MYVTETAFDCNLYIKNHKHKKVICTLKIKIHIFASKRQNIVKFQVSESIRILVYTVQYIIFNIFVLRKIKL